MPSGSANNDVETRAPAHPRSLISVFVELFALLLVCLLSYLNLLQTKFQYSSKSL